MAASAPKERSNVVRRVVAYVRGGLCALVAFEQCDYTGGGGVPGACQGGSGETDHGSERNTLAPSILCNVLGGSGDLQGLEQDKQVERDEALGLLSSIRNGNDAKVDGGDYVEIDGRTAADSRSKLEHSWFSRIVEPCCAYACRCPGSSRASCMDQSEVS